VTSVSRLVHSALAFELKRAAWQGDSQDTFDSIGILCFLTFSRPRTIVG